MSVYKNSRLLTTVNYFVVSLAITDVLMGAAAMPFTEACAVVGKWIFGHCACQFADLIISIFQFCSIFNLTVMAVSGYLKILIPNV